jgi:phage shock protein E
MDAQSLTVLALVVLAAFFVIMPIFKRKTSGDTVLKMIREGAQVVDVRTPAEYASGSYPKAKNIPLDRLPARMGELRKDRGVVVFCASGSRSAQAARLLKRSGFPDAVSAGGLSDMPRL